MSVTRAEVMNIVNNVIEKETNNQKEYGETNKELGQSIQQMMLQMGILSEKLNSAIEKIDKYNGLREAYEKVLDEFRELKRKHEKLDNILTEFKEQYIGNSSRSKGKNEGKNKAFTDIRVWLALTLTAGISAFTVWINLRG